MNREQQKIGESMGLSENLKVGDSTPPATPVEPTCVACDKGDHQHCLGGVCACIHSRDWERQDEEWSAGDDQPASHLPPAALPAVSGEGERLKEQAAAYRAIALDALACWQG